MHLYLDMVSMNTLTETCTKAVFVLLQHSLLESKHMVHKKNSDFTQEASFLY